MFDADGDNAEELILRELNMLEPLMELFGKEDAKLLEYWYDNSLYSNWKKPPAKFVLKEDAMREEIAEYRGMGFDFVATFACFLGKDYEELHGDVNVKPFAECTN